MPGEGGDYFARLQTEMSGEQQSAQALALAEARRSELNRQMSGEEPFLFTPFRPRLAGRRDRGAGDITFRIQELEARLEEMRLRYHRQAS